MATHSAGISADMPASVLLVENDGFQAMAAEDALLEAGVSDVRCCATTEAAIAELDASMPDAIVLDSRLDDRDDGWAIAELIEALGVGRPTIVFATGNPQEIPAHIVELGTLLPKPYTASALVNAVRPREGRIAGHLRRALHRSAR